MRNDGFNKFLHFLFTPTVIWVQEGDVLGMRSCTCLPVAGRLQAKQMGGRVENCIFLPVCGRRDHFKEEAPANPVEPQTAA